MAAALVVALAGFTAPDSAAQPATPRIKNVIVMVSDGAGYNTLEATRLWTGKPLAVDDRRFSRASLAVWPLSTRKIPGGTEQEPEFVYKSAKAWNSAPLSDQRECPETMRGVPAITYELPLDGYNWHCATYPDSANTMSAMMTGVRSYNNAINVDGAGVRQRSAAEAAVAGGRLAGVVTTADVTDATSASGGGAHNISRSNREAIGAEMFGGTVLTVIGGAGHPEYFNDGSPRKVLDHSVIDANTWASLDAGTGGWTLVDDAKAIRRLAAGRSAVPGRLAMIGRARDGLQQYRCADGVKPSQNADCQISPSATERPARSHNKTQPRLVELTKAALRRLNQGEEGLFLVIEESNTDRAAHRNNLGRVIEARMEFEMAVTEVVRWIDSPRSKATWKDTILIITADHDHLLMGPNALAEPFQSVQGSGRGRLPSHRWLADIHSNQLVPLFVRGAGTAEMIALADSNDDRLPSNVQRCGQCVRYLDQAEMGEFLLEALSR